MSEILIVGGTGFLGSNTARAFADAGIPVVVTSRKRYDPVAEDLKAESSLITVERVDCSRASEVFDLFSRYNFRGVMLSAQVHQYAVTRAANNATYEITFNCMDAAVATGVKRFVLVSSIVVYQGLNAPFKEDVAFPVEVSHEIGPFNALRVPKFEVVMKRVVEQIVLDYGTPMEMGSSLVDAKRRPHQLEVVALRMPTMFGPRYSIMGSPISHAMHAAAGKGGMDGLGYLNVPVKMLWDLISLVPLGYTKDCASAVKTVMEAETLPNRIYNVSSGFDTSPRAQLEAVYRVAPKSREVIGMKLEDLVESHVDIGFNSDLLKKDFGWRSVYTLDSALEDYLSWLKNHQY